MNNSNRVVAYVQKIQERLVALGWDNATKTEKAKTLDMSLEEYCRFQELKSLAFANGKLSQDEAQTIYGYLGNSLETFNKQSYAVKAVLTKIFAELLQGQELSKANGQTR